MGGVGLSGASIGLNRTCHEVSHAERGSMGFSVGGGLLGFSGDQCRLFGSVGVTGLKWSSLGSHLLSGSQWYTVEVSGTQKGSVALCWSHWDSVRVSGDQCVTCIHPISSA